MHQVRSDVPMPIVGVRRHETGRFPKYPFGTMKVGDSFVIKRDDVRRATSAASMFGRRNGMTFTCRKNEDGTATCWRLK